MLRALALFALTTQLIVAQAPTAPAARAATGKRSNVKDNLVVVEPDGRFKCVLPDGKACAADDLKPVSIPGLKAITAKGSDGYITCERADGKPCDATQVEAVSAAIRKGYDLKSGKAGRIDPNIRIK